MNKLEELSNRIRVPMGREDRSGVGFWVVTPSKGRVIEFDIRNIPFEEYLNEEIWGEEGFREITELKTFMLELWEKLSEEKRKEHIDWIYCDFLYRFPSPNNLSLFPPLDMEERLQKGELKEGDLGKCLIFGNGMCYVDTVEIGKIVHSHIGQNLKLVLSTLQNLNSSFLDGWKFRLEQKEQTNLSQLKDYYIRYGISFGECLVLENEDIGRINLYENKLSTENEILLELIEVWGKRTLNGEEKGSVGRSLLTLLNRITKGYDIVLRLNVGDVHRRKNKVKHNKVKLVEWYQKNGFTLEGNVKGDGLVQMSNIEIVEEYWDRLEEEDKDQKRLDDIQKRIDEVEKVDVNEFFKK